MWRGRAGKTALSKRLLDLSLPSSVARVRARWFLWKSSRGRSNETNGRKVPLINVPLA
jgi:hypothetical protein